MVKRRSTTVVAVDDEGVWIDEGGNEFKGSYATPIKKGIVKKSDAMGADNVLPRNTNDQERDTGRNALRGEDAAGGQTGRTDDAVSGSDERRNIDSGGQRLGETEQFGLFGESSGNRGDRANDKRDSPRPIPTGNPREVPANYRITGEEGTVTGGLVYRTHQNLEARTMVREKYLFLPEEEGLEEDEECSRVSARF